MGLFSSSKNTNRQVGSNDTQQASSTSRRVEENAPTPSTTSQQSASAPTQYRPIFLLVWANPLFKAHWALFIPDISDKTLKSGKYVHVTGDLKNGFSLEIVRGWDISLTRRRPGTPIEIGWVPSDWIVDTPTSGTDLVKEKVPRDKLEQLIASVPAPGKSLNSSGKSAASKPPELSDCQWWVTRCVKLAVEQGVLIPPQKGLNKHKDPRQILLEAPRH